MELQQRQADFERAGIAVFAISYDAVDVLRTFADKFGITYDLLADEGSHTIRALGLLNQHIAEQHAAYGVKVRDEHYGVAYPGIFVLDERGAVAEKRFEQSYRVRLGGALLVEELVGDAKPAVQATAEGEGVQIAAWLGSPTYRPWQKLRLNLALRIAPGLHVYGTPVPDGFTPLAVDLEPLEGLVSGPVELPAPRPFRVEGFDEDFVVHEGTVGATLPLAILGPNGDVTLGVRVRYQACSATICYPPSELRLELPLRGLELLRD